MTGNIVKTSIFMVPLRKIGRTYCLLIDGLVKISKDSQIYALMMKFWDGAKINFKYSFLGRIFGIKKENNPVILQNSRFVRWLTDMLGSLKFKVIGCGRTSEAIKITTELKEEMYLSPFKSIGIILFAATFANILFSLAFHRQMGAFAWIIRLMFLFVGIASFYCNADWKTIKETSFFLRE